MKFFSTLLIAAIALLCTSCLIFVATIPNVVRVEQADQDTSTQVFIDGRLRPTKANGKYYIFRKPQPQEIRIEKRDHLPVQRVYTRYKRRGAHYFCYLTYADRAYYKKGPRKLSFDSNIKDIPEYNNSYRKLAIHEVKVDLTQNDVHYSETKYKDYAENDGYNPAETVNYDYTVSLENTVFSSVLNEILVDKGYIDTSKVVLKTDYVNNVYIAATVNDYVVNRTYDKNTSYQSYQIELGIRWKLLDNYKNKIYSIDTRAESGQFSMYQNRVPDDVSLAIKQAINVGFVEFFYEDRIQELLTDSVSQKNNETLAKTITINRGPNYVKTMDQALNASVTIKRGRGHGSGFLVSHDGYIITNHHVVGESKEVEVFFHGKETGFKAEVIRSSKIHDLALIKVSLENGVPYSINDAQKAKIASDIMTIGTPKSRSLPQSFSKGIVSSYRQLKNDRELMQTDASINSGNSGGPLINNNLEVVGIVSSKLIGFGIEGVAFGIPAQSIQKFLHVNQR